MRAAPHRRALSNNVVGQLTPHHVEYVAWDLGQPTFGVRVYPTGRKVYIVRQRIADAQATVLIGRSDAVPYDIAKQEARRLIVEVADGERPNEEVRRRRLIPSFEAFTREFVERCAPKWKPSTRATHTIYLARWIEPGFSGLFIDEIDRAMVSSWFERVTATSPGAANRALDVLASMLRKAASWGYRAGLPSPVAGIARNPCRLLNRFLSESEIGRLGRALEVKAGRQPVHAACVRFLMLTGLRRREALDLDWKHVGPTWIRLEDSKTGPRVLNIGRAARAALGRSSTSSSGAVFANGGQRLSIPAIESFWLRLKADAGITNLRLHDLRHNFASCATIWGEPLSAVSTLLGHAKIASTARYAHLDDVAILAAAERIGAAITAALRHSP